METWGDAVKYFREKFPYLLAPLTDNGLEEVVLIMLDDISQNKVDITKISQEALLKRCLRQSDAFINLIYEDEIYNKNIPGRIKADIFLNQFVPQRSILPTKITERGKN